jgi:hypothetical protein
MAHINVKDHQMTKVSIWQLSVTIILLYVVFLSRLEHGLKYAYVFGAFRFFFNDYGVLISKCLWFNVRLFSLYEVSHFLCFECIMNSQFKHFISHPLPLRTSLGFKIESHVVFSFVTFCLSPLKSFSHSNFKNKTFTCFHLLKPQTTKSFFLSFISFHPFLQTFTCVGFTSPKKNVV